MVAITDPELEQVEQDILALMAQVGEARRALGRGEVPELSSVQDQLTRVELRFQRHSRDTLRHVAGPLIGLHEEIEGMVADLTASKQAVEANLDASARHARAHRAYGGDPGAGRRSARPPHPAARCP